MSAMVLQFRARLPRPDVGRPDENGVHSDWVQHTIQRWAREAGHYDWFLIETKPEGRRHRKLPRLQDTASITIGHYAVDNEGIFQLTPEFDGWALLSRRGDLSVFATLQEALFSICPATIAA